MAVRELLRLRSDVEMMKTASGHMLTVGTVHAVDPVRGYRIAMGEGTEGEMLSPWLPHPESGGQTQSWMPLSVGQIVGVLSPSGDMRQGVLLRGGFGGDNSPPSADMAANVLKAFGITAQMKDGVLSLTADHIIATANRVDLGGEGGKRVARITDRVHVKTGSSAGLWPIVEASETVFAVD